MDPPPPSLGALPPELTARILLLLPLLDRVRCESVNRAWCAFLRAPACHASVDSRALVRECRVEGRRLHLSDAGIEGRGLSTGDALARFAARAGAQLRALTLAGDAHVRALLPVFVRAPPALAELRVTGATAPTLVALLEGLAREPPLLEACEITLDCAAMVAQYVRARDGLGEDDSAACRLLCLRAAADLSLRLTLPFLTNTDGDDEMADDVRAVRCVRLGRLLALSRWRRVRLALPHGVAAAVNDDTSALATLCETLLAGMADGSVARLPAVTPATFVFDLREMHMEAQEAARVAEAAPPHARLLLGAVLCGGHDDQYIQRALRPGRVTAAILLLEDEDINVARLTGALAALRAAAAAVQDDDPQCGGFELHLSSYWETTPAEVLATLYTWLCAHPRVLAGLQLRIEDAGQIAALLAALSGSHLRHLTLQLRRGLEEHALLSVAAALDAGELSRLEKYTMNRWVPTVAATQAIAQALRHRTTHFELHFEQAPDMHAMAVPALVPLITTPHPASGVPLHAVHQLVQAIAGDDPAQRLAAVNALATQSAPLFTIIALHRERCFEPEEAEHGQALGDVAALLLHADALLPADTTASLLRPTARVMLLAACVRHARWPAAAADARNFTPLLQRALLLWSRFGRDADATPRVLGDITAACMRELPSDDAASHIALEARYAIRAVLLACGLAGGACAQEPRLAAASTWLADRVGWLLQQLFPLDETCRPGAKLRIHPLPALAGRPSRSRCLLDAAQLLSALVRVPLLRAALWRAPAFPAVLHELLCTDWKTSSDRQSDDVPEMAAATAYVALANLLQDAGFQAFLKAAWMATDAAQLNSTTGAGWHPLVQGVRAASAINILLHHRAENLRAADIQPPLPTERRQAADAAAAHVSLVVKELRLLEKAQPTDTDRVIALQTLVDNVQRSSIGSMSNRGAEETSKRLELLRIIMLQRAGGCTQGDAIAFHALFGIVKTCSNFILPSISTATGITAALVTLLAYVLVADRYRRFLPLLDAYDAAQYLATAWQLPEMADALAAESPDVATVLLMGTWTAPRRNRGRQGLADPSGALMAAAVYKAIAHMLMPPERGANNALATLVKRWCAADAAVELRSGAAWQGVGGAVSMDHVLAHLAGEAARLAALRLTFHADAGACAAAEEAMLHLNALQQQLLKHLQQRRILAPVGA